MVGVLVSLPFFWLPHGGSHYFMFYVSVGHHDYGSSIKQNFKGLSFNTFTTRSFEAKEPRTPAVLKMVIFHKAWRTLMFIRTWYTW